MNRDFTEGAIVGASLACLAWIVFFVLAGGLDRVSVAAGQGL